MATLNSCIILRKESGWLHELYGALTSLKEMGLGHQAEADDEPVGRCWKWVHTKSQIVALFYGHTLNKIKQHCYWYIWKCVQESSVKHIGK